jgi:hypothetical protein
MSVRQRAQSGFVTWEHEMDKDSFRTDASQSLVGKKLPWADSRRVWVL